MALIERIQKDLTQAMMSKDELRLSVLRMVKSALKYKEIEKVRALEDAESLQVLQTLVKQRRESVEQFAKGGRQDLADKETKEIAILENYLPAAPSDSDMNAAIANKSGMPGCGSKEFATRPSEQHMSSTSHQRSSRRRSMASANAPPHNAVNASGTSCTVPNKPTIADDFVRS